MNWSAIVFGVVTETTSRRLDPARYTARVVQLRFSRRLLKLPYIKSIP